MSGGEGAGTVAGTGPGDVDGAGCLAPNVNEATAWEISWRIAREPPCSSSILAGTLCGRLQFGADLVAVLCAWLGSI